MNDTPVCDVLKAALVKWGTLPCVYDRQPAREPAQVRAMTQDERVRLEGLSKERGGRWFGAERRGW